MVTELTHDDVREKSGGDEAAFQERLRHRSHDRHRIHRSALVQIDRVRELRAVGNGDYKVVLADCTVLPMTQRYRERLREA